MKAAGADIKVVTNLFLDGVMGSMLIGKLNMKHDQEAFYELSRLLYRR